MATQIVPAPERVDHPAFVMSDADREAHDLASYVRPKVAEHEKTKDPLPTRPRGPHPQRATAVA